MYYSLLFHSFMKGHYGCFQVFAIVSKNAINTRVQVLCGHMFSTHFDNYS